MKTQVDWLIWAFRCWPNSTTGEIYDRLRENGHTIRNITGRMSDARAKGVEFHSYVDEKGNYRYSVVKFTMPVEQAIAPEKNTTLSSPGIRFTMEPDDITDEVNRGAQR
jgi:hypothetical protein